MTVLFISIGGMPFMATTLDIADSLFAIVITPGFYLHHVQMADRNQHPSAAS